MHDKCRQLGKVAPPHGNRHRCRFAGVCYHDHLGLQACEDAILAVLREWFKKGSAYKACLEFNLGILRVCWSSLPEKKLQDITYFAVSYTNQNSWAITLLSVYPDTDADAMAEASLRGWQALRLGSEDSLRRLLRGDDVRELLGVDNLPRTLSKCDRNCCASVQLLQVRCDDIPLSIPWCPAQIFVNKLSPQEDFWPGTEHWQASVAAAAAAKPPKRARVGVGSGVVATSAPGTPTAADMGLVDGSQDDLQPVTGPKGVSTIFTGMAWAQVFRSARVHC